MKYNICQIAFLLLLSGTLYAQKKQNEIYYPVLRIIDGDTFRIADGTSKGQSVRLIGVDAPEIRNSGNKVKHALGNEATAYLYKLIGGKVVRLEFDVDRTDRYGRTLAYVYLPDGTFVNAELLKNGYASIMTIQPNVKYQDYFLKLERRARNNNKGLWRD